GPERRARSAAGRPPAPRRALRPVEPDRREERQRLARLPWSERGEVGAPEPLRIAGERGHRLHLEPLGRGRHPGKRRRREARRGELLLANPRQKRRAFPRRRVPPPEQGEGPIEERQVLPAPHVYRPSRGPRDARVFEPGATERLEEKPRLPRLDGEPGPPEEPAEAERVGEERLPHCGRHRPASARASARRSRAPSPRSRATSSWYFSRPPGVRSTAPGCRTR